MIFNTFLMPVLLFSALLFFALFIYSAIISYQEKEYYAVKKLLFLLLIPIALFGLWYFSFPFKIYIVWICISLMLLGGFLLFLPVKQSLGFSDSVAVQQIDERDTMFSRAELLPESKTYEAYYTLRPKNKAKDDKFRANPGLLSDTSKFYETMPFHAAEASFYTVSRFRDFVNPPKGKTKKAMSAKAISLFLKKWATELGAHSVGITKLQTCHLYSHRGRGKNYGQKVENNHSFAIAFTVEMDYDLVHTAPKSPTVMESAHQYLNAGAIAVQLAAFISSLGYSARAHIDGKYDVVCPLVAKDAGLGEIGRMGLLMTPTLGPRVRIGVVTTDIPLVADARTFDTSVLHFCTLCKKCAYTCPSQAIPFEKRTDINGVERWQINSEACYTYWTKSGTDCARCISVCPYSHPDNLFHNFVRFGNKNSAIFRRVAVIMDDYIYGKKPKPLPVPDWINTE